MLALAYAGASGADGSPCDKNHYILIPEACVTLASQVAVGAPAGVTVHSSGKVFFSSQNVVFSVDGDGVLERVAGTGQPGFAGDGGPATNALLNFPALYPELEYDPFDFWEFAAGLAFDASGNLYIADSYNNRVRKVDARDGTIGTYFWSASIKAGPFWPQGLAFDSRGRLHVSEQYGQLFRVARENGPVETIARLEIPEAIAIDRHDNIFVAEAVCVVRMVRPDGLTTRVAGTENCWLPERGGDLSYPYGVAVDAAGNVFIADTYHNCVRRKDAAGGELKTIAGTCSWSSRGFSGDGGPAEHARLHTPHGVAVDEAGNVYVADTGNYRMRRISPDGRIETIAGNGRPLGE